MFAFKQFTIHQDRCAMKVGTDGVLLGAWTRVTHCHNVLDVGTGTGLIALMVAQRSLADVVGIDLDADAVAQAMENVAASPWSHRVRIIEMDVRNVDNLLKTDETFSPNLSFRPPFDAILCNPPYFANSLKCPDAARAMARHTDTLSFDELAGCVARLLSEDGEFSVVIPYDRAADMTVSAACYGLFATRQTVVCTKQGARPKRVLMAFSRQGASHTPDVLCIQDAQHCYTSEYIGLVKDFYLKM